MKKELDQIGNEVQAAINRKAEIIYWLNKKKIDYPKNLSGAELMASLKAKRSDNYGVSRTFTAYARYWDDLSKAEDDLQELGQQYCGETAGWAAMILGILTFFDKARDQNPDLTQLRTNVSSASGCRNLDYFVFICPAINITSDGTGYYIYPNPERTAIYTNRGNFYKQLASWLKYAGAIPNLLVFIGDTDDTDYIYPAIGNPKDFDWAERDKMIQKMKTNTIQLVTKKIQAENMVLSWFLDMPPKPSEIAIFQPDISLSEEFRISELFSAENFYGRMTRPNQTQITTMANLKVDTYGRQGQAIKTRYSPCFGIQMETPSLLRSEMLNTLNGNQPIPFIYPYIFKP
jgi:hypothetical protein